MKKTLRKHRMQAEALAFLALVASLSSLGCNDRGETPTSSSPVAKLKAAAGVITTTVTATETATGTETRTVGDFGTVTKTITSMRIGTDPTTVTATETVTALATVTKTFTETLTATGTTTGTAIGTVTLTQTGTETASGTATQTSVRTQTVTGTITVTATATASGTQTRTQTDTGTRTVTQAVTQTVTQTLTTSSTATDTAIGTVVTTSTGTATQTVGGTATYAQDYFVTATVTSTNTATVYWTSWPQTLGNTSTATTTNYVQGAVSSTMTFTGTGSQNGTQTRSGTAVVTGSGISTATATVPVTVTATWAGVNAGTGSKTVTATGAATGTASLTWTYQPTGTVTQTQSTTSTGTITRTVTNTSSGTVTNTGTASGTGTAPTTVTTTATDTVTGTTTTSNTGTATVSSTVPDTATITNSWTRTTSNTATGTGTVTTTSTQTSTSPQTSTRTALGVVYTTLTETYTAYSTTTNTATGSAWDTMVRTSTRTLTSTITVTQTATTTSTNDITVILAFPNNLGFDSVVGAANGAVQIGDRSKTLAVDGKPGPISNAGNDLSDIGVVSNVGTFTSVGSVFLRDRSIVSGDVTTAGGVQYQNNVTVTGKVTENAVVTPLTYKAWSTAIPAATRGDVFPTSASGPVTPGRYGQLTAYSGTSVTLSSGTYYVSSFDLEPQAQLNLNMSAGPVIVYVTGNIVFRGTMTKQSGTDGAFMLVSLGDSDVYIESPLTGTVVVPRATLTLGSVVPMTFQGNFYGRKLIVRPDTTLIATPFPWNVVSGGVPGCDPMGPDSDQDGVPDCADGCPLDPNKTVPGICHCGVPETDDDSDLAPNCIDECPNDPDKVTRGQCGCKDQPGLAVAGTPCTDSAGPQPGATCNGAGVCGNPDASRPASGCVSMPHEGVTYWFCGVWSSEGKKARNDADSDCKAKGLTLVRLEDPLQNEWIRTLLPVPVWIGANDLGTAGSWRWSTPQSNDGDQFWSGGPGGSRIGDWFTYWASGAPQDSRCAIMDQKTGRWSDAECSTALGYVCEYKPPLNPRTEEPVPGQVGPGIPFSTCVNEGDPNAPRMLPTPVGDPPSDAAIAAAQAQLLEDIDAAQSGHFGRSAGSPPSAGSTCPIDPKAMPIAIPGVDGGPMGCQLTNQRGTYDGCISDEDCSAYGSDYVCRRIPAIPWPYCDPSLGGCGSYTRCGIVDCSNLTDNLPCDMIDVCNPGTDMDAGWDPSTKEDAGVLDPTTLFQNGPVDAAPTPGYSDDPTGTHGVNHAWCRMRTQNPDSVPTAEKSTPSEGPKTTQGKSVSLNFDPNLTFKVNPNPLAFGESNLELHAGAGINAWARLDKFMKVITMDRLPILEAAVDIVAKRCSISTKGTVFKVFDVPVPLDQLGVPLIDTTDESSDLYEASKACNDAIAQYQIFAGRVKKAFRDAQQLLKQYHDARGLGKALAGNICDILDLAPDVPGFPGGSKCWPNESVESMINRFIDYYQMPGAGQVSQLISGATALGKSSGYLRKKIGEKFKEMGAEKSINIKFSNWSHSQVDTIVSIPFAIGPVPCLLQVDLATSYGVDGAFQLELEFPTNLFGGKGSKSPIASASANVLPHAGAGIAVFVGAGFDYGAFSASIGIEGSLTLADIQVPLFAKAGLNVEVQEETRVLPDDVKPPVSVGMDAFQFGFPRTFLFSAFYEYGAAIDVNKVLNGQLSVRLRIKFCFFSRTWRKQILSFKGFSKHIELIKGGGTLGISVGPKSVPSSKPATTGTTAQVATGETTMGRSESEVPLMQLQYVSERTPLPSVDGGVPGDNDPVMVSTDKVESFFYDQQCCAKPGAACQENKSPFPACCPGAVCNVPKGADSGTCETIPTCGKESTACTKDSDCCQGLQCGSGGVCEQPPTCGTTGTPCTQDATCCTELICGSQGQCMACLGMGQACQGSKDCCQNAGRATVCGSQNRCQTCTQVGYACTTSADCCPGGDSWGCGADNKCFSVIN